MLENHMVMMDEEEYNERYNCYAGFDNYDEPNLDTGPEFVAYLAAPETQDDDTDYDDEDDEGY
ncbi:MAG: hypothetical protein KIH63_004590 [Candidatus Saccharibacteria bacterium]|nr:hypothetical protein [Candidatus Saccharibacteria bacterium]